jgi:NAD(P) transhydrogenase
MEEYDAIIIGSGPSGQKAAMASKKMGKKVALIEEWDFGGSSLHSGTIPSKTLREAIVELTNYQQRHFYSHTNSLCAKQKISMSDLCKRIDWVKEKIQQTLLKQLTKNGIDLFLGRASFINPHVVEIEEKGGKTRSIRGEKIFIATGSIPRKPKNIPFDGDKILTSTDFLSMKAIPKSLIVIGAGVIGCEYASMMSVLGVEVTLIDKNKRILSFLDQEIGSHLQISLEEHQLKFIREKDYTHITVEKDLVEVTFSDGTTISAEKVLVAAGRKAHISHLKLENAGLTLTDKGYVEVSKNFQTKVPNIYAVGDVIGGPCLSSTSYIQGSYAADCAFSNNVCKQMPLYPYGIYTLPEISYIGETEETLKEKNIPYEVGRAYYYEISRSIISGTQTGVCKLLFHRKNFTLLGAHIIGTGAVEIIHIAQLAISLNAKIHYFVDHVFNFPTYAEMYAIAARNGINKVLVKEKELQKGKRV